MMTKQVHAVDYVPPHDEAALRRGRKRGYSLDQVQRMIPELAKDAADADGIDIRITGRGLEVICS